jgi:hypothetical protein
MAYSPFEQFTDGVVAVFYGHNQGSFTGAANLVCICATI